MNQDTDGIPEGKLWHEGKTDDDMLMFSKAELIYNLTEDIGCLKEALYEQVQTACLEGYINARAPGEE